MIETPIFFPSGDAHLFGMLHVPKRAKSKLAFLLSHPFGEEKLWSHRVFVSFARALAARGHPVMRFDYTGAGDSSGVTPDANLSTYNRDIAAALDTLISRQPAIKRVGLVGLRLGATIAALLAESAAAHGKQGYLQDAPLILWDPIMDGEVYFQELLRSNLSTQLAVYGKVQHDREALRAKILSGATVNVDGYEIGKDLFESCARTDLLQNTAKKHAGPTLIVQIAANDKLNVRQDLQSLAQSYPQGIFVRTSEQAFWREIKPFYGRAENLQRETLTWLEQARV